LRRIEFTKGYQKPYKIENGSHSAPIESLSRHIESIKGYWYPYKATKGSQSKNVKCWALPQASTMAWLKATYYWIHKIYHL